ncbi:hypothetical protein V8E51_004440 [Hyaloscypha variabilis]
MHSPVSPTTTAYSSAQRSFKCSTESPNSPVSEPTTIPRTLPSPSQAAFICTICWQHQDPGAKPKLLGISARIVCHACWRAVLDLSICWVCGECIVRGDEVVSLGWCFWHRGCFGCLMCRTRMNVAGLEARVSKQTAEWDRWDGSEDNEFGRRRSVGIELDTIPLCNVCSVEMAAESQNQVLERGLECVSEIDGGLSRDRLDMLTELAEERESGINLARGLCTRNSRRLKGATGIEQDLKRFINRSSGRFTNDLYDPGDLASLLENAADMGKTSDGTLDREQWQSRKIVTSSDQSQDVEQSDVYVSVLDPFGEPAFKPIKFKPLPSWMNLLPNNIHRERRQKNNVFPEHNSQHQLKASPSVENEESGSIASSEDSCSSPVALVDIPNLRGWKNNASIEQSRDVSQTMEKKSDYHSSHPQPPRRRTPYPQDFPRLLTLRKDASAAPTQPKHADIVEEPLSESCCELGSQLQHQQKVHEDRLLRRGKDTQTPAEVLSPSASTSSGHLDRDQLQSPGPEKARQTGRKSEPKPGRPRREKSGQQNMVKSIRAKGKKLKNKMVNAEMGVRVASEAHGVVRPLRLGESS